MSAALVRQSLEITDPDVEKVNKRSNKGKVFDLIPENHKITKKAKGSKDKLNVLSTIKKHTVIEIKRNNKNKAATLKEKQKRLKQYEEACYINLDKNVAKKIIKRAVTKRPVGPKQKHKKPQKTAFTEEDFKKFEEEYFDE